MKAIPSVLKCAEVCFEAHQNLDNFVSFTLNKN